MRTFASAVTATLIATGAVALSSVTDVDAVPSPDVVISQVYGGGGNSGATLTNDFIELYNRGTEPVPLDGWTVQYASAAGTTWAQTPLTGTLPAGSYYLVQEAQGAGGTTPLPTPDATGTIAMSGTSGKVALVTSSRRPGMRERLRRRRRRARFRRLRRFRQRLRDRPDAHAQQYHGGHSRRRWSHRHRQQQRRLHRRALRIRGLRRRLRAAATAVGLRRARDPRDRRGPGHRHVHPGARGNRSRRGGRHRRPQRRRPVRRLLRAGRHTRRRPRIVRGHLRRVERGGVRGRPGPRERYRQRVVRPDPGRGLRRRRLRHRHDRGDELRPAAARGRHLRAGRVDAAHLPGGAQRHRAFPARPLRRGHGVFRRAPLPTDRPCRSGRTGDCARRREPAPAAARRRRLERTEPADGAVPHPRRPAPR